MKIKANGININYEIDGVGGLPWLVFSNSLSTNLHMWDTQANDLKNSCRVLRYDQRGHGQSDAPAGRYTFAMLIADAVGLMDALNVKRAHFAGLSMGGVTAMGMAQLHPARVDKAIVCDTPCLSTPQTAQMWEERIAAVEKAKSMEPLVEPTIERWFPADIRARKPAYIDKVRQMVRASPVNGLIGCAAALANHDYNAKAGTVTRPVLFIVGEKDGATPAIMKQMHERLKGSKFVELAGAGHISNMDRPAEFTRAIREFLAG
jgi:3-oxoadipate enol-lactonase